MINFRISPKPNQKKVKIITSKKCSVCWGRKNKHLQWKRKLFFFLKAQSLFHLNCRYCFRFICIKHPSFLCAKLTKTFLSSAQNEINFAIWKSMVWWLLHLGWSEGKLCFLIMKFSSNYAWQIKHQLRLTRNWGNVRWNLYRKCPLAILIKRQSFFFSLQVPRWSILFLPISGVLRNVISHALIQSLKLIFSNRKTSSLSLRNEKHRRKWKMRRRRTINVIWQSWVWSHSKQGNRIHLLWGWFQTKRQR